jgi:hypothetical protein
MKPSVRFLLALFLLMALVAPEQADAARRRHYPRHRAPVHRPSLHRKAPRPVRTPEPNPYPLYLGDLYVMSSTASLWSKPASGAQVLAKLPRRTVVTNMGRVAVRVRRGAAYFYKVEAPNGKVGYVQAAQLSPQPPDW